MRAALQISERFNNLRKLENIRKISSFGGDTS